MRQFLIQHELVFNMNKNCMLDIKPNIIDGVGSRVAQCSNQECHDHENPRVLEIYPKVIPWEIEIELMCPVV